MKMLLSLLRRDLILAARQGGGVGNALGFFLTFLVLLPIGIGTAQSHLPELAPGILCFRVLRHFVVS